MKRYLAGIGIVFFLLSICSFHSSHAKGIEPVPREKRVIIPEEEVWRLPIQAIGQGEEDFQDPEKVPCNISTRYIGMDANAVSSEGPPTPPSSTAFLFLNGDLFKDIRKIGSSVREVWTFNLLIGPYADPGLDHFYPVLSWDPNKITWDPNEWDPNEIIPAAVMQLRQGETEEGTVLIEDMTTTKTYQTQESEAVCIPGEGCLLTYSIVFESAYKTYYPDSDGDDHGDPNKGERLIEQPSGYFEMADDCDDTNPDTFPGAPEICDGEDNDCDGFTPSDELTDNDGDGAISCADCYDDDPDCYPGAVEECDDKDNDCDSEVDEEDAQGCRIYYKDQDGDEYGVDTDSRCLCAPDGEEKYTALHGGDPDDFDPEIPGSNYFNIDMELSAGWSMISLPVEREDSRIKTLFPEAKAVFKFTDSYELLDPNDPLEKGWGYWIYLPEEKTYSVYGTPIINYQIPNLRKGWSMIGSCSYPAYSSVDSGIIKAVFGFTDSYILLGSGIEVGPLIPGQGYWIYLSDEADLLVE